MEEDPQGTSEYKSNGSNLHSEQNAQNKKTILQKDLE